jgi:hypothetical protein
VEYYGSLFLGDCSPQASTHTSCRLFTNLPLVLLIPVLLLFGQLEKLLDADFGPTTSMAMRLMTGG